MINMHSFSIEDKTVTFQYENVNLHVSISQRSLINTPVLRSENTLFQSNKLIFYGHVESTYVSYLQCTWYSPF